MTFWKINYQSKTHNLEKTSKYDGLTLILHSGNKLCIERGLTIIHLFVSKGLYSVLNESITKINSFEMMFLLQSFHFNANHLNVWLMRIDIEHWDERSSVCVWKRERERGYKTNLVWSLHLGTQFFPHFPSLKKDSSPTSYCVKRMN